MDTKGIIIVLAVIVVVAGAMWSFAAGPGPAEAPPATSADTAAPPATTPEKAPAPVSP
jgi:hypothetical protein